MRSWRLSEIETPDGSRSPIVLHSGDEGRAVLIGLQPGQELGDHQVKEHAFLVVVEGRARIVAGSDTLEADAGTLVAFAPDERRVGPDDAPDTAPDQPVRPRPVALLRAANDRTARLGLERPRRRPNFPSTR